MHKDFTNKETNKQTNKSNHTRYIISYICKLLRKLWHNNLVPTDFKILWEVAPVGALFTHGALKLLFCIWLSSIAYLQDLCWISKHFKHLWIKNTISLTKIPPILLIDIIIINVLFFYLDLLKSSSYYLLWSKLFLHETSLFLLKLKILKLCYHQSTYVLIAIILYNVKTDLWS